MPVQALDEQSGARMDARTAVEANPRICILGQPGAGKTVLVQQVALSLLGRHPRELRRGLPILLALRRLDDSGRSLVEELAAQLERDGIVGADGLVPDALRQGHLVLLLDGLDEVARTSRARVTQEICDLAATHPECQVVVTCRSAVYEQVQDALEASFRPFRIGDLDDHLILQFLRTWPGIPPDGAAQLMDALREAPRIIALARNPLLLTILGYLYASAGPDAPVEQWLPRSRVDFYQKATDALLQHWRHQDSRFPKPLRRVVLERLALSTQDRMERSRHDPLTVPYRDVRQQVAAVLAEWRYGGEDPAGVIREVVEQSGLLLSLDAEERYQFAHLTVQEYFAACALRDDLDGLLERYRANPEAWREPLLLWCGLAADGPTDRAALGHRPDHGPGVPRQRPAGRPGPGGSDRGGVRAASGLG